jgi:prevent-host-death family protein
MTTIGTAEAKAKLSELLDRVEKGEEIVIERYGKPVARLVAAGLAGTRKPLLGAMKGKIWMADHWDAPMTEEELRQWYESPIDPGFSSTPTSSSGPSKTPRGSRKSTG